MSGSSGTNDSVFSAMGRIKPGVPPLCVRTPIELISFSPMASRPCGRRLGTLRISVKPSSRQVIAPPRKSRWRPVLALLPAAVLLGTVTSARARAEDTPSRLDQQMAGYVLNFTKFVEWPESSHPQELVICVAGNPGLYAALRE